MVGLKVVKPGQELILISAEGVVIRMNVDDISVISRNTQGVTLMKTGAADKVVSLELVKKKTVEE